jgi:hypothetical protein
MPYPQNIGRSSSMTPPDAVDSPLTTSERLRTAPQHVHNVLLIIAQVIVGASAKILTSLR